MPVLLLSAGQAGATLPACLAGAVSQAWADKSHWDRMSILNVARMGKFSSDRTIREYARDIWKIQAIPPEEPAPPRPRKKRKVTAEEVV